MTRRSARNYGRKDQKSTSLKKRRKIGRKGKPSTPAKHSGFEVVLRKSGLEAEPSHYGDQAKEPANDEPVLPAKHGDQAKEPANDEPVLPAKRQESWIKHRTIGPNGTEYIFIVIPQPPRPKPHGGPPTKYDDYD